MSALREAFDSIASRRVILFGGKGGVGKTTMAALAALHYSASRKVILFSTDPASNLADLFGDDAPANIKIESLDAEALYARFLDANLSAFLELGDRGTYLDREELRRLFELALPGVDELMAWSRIGELAESNPDATIVVDTAPTGHTVRMLFSSQHFAQLAHALDALQEKHRNIVRQLTRRNVRDAMDEFIDKFAADAERHRGIVREGAFVPVMLSEPWVVEQTKRLIEEVRTEKIDVPLVILNRAATQCDCARCRARAAADEEAKRQIENVIAARRSCGPLDDVETLKKYLDEDRSVSPWFKTTEAPRARGQLQATSARLVFFAGKGGVGKTTSSASYALQIARARPNQRFVIISVDPAHSLRDVFGSEQPPPNLTVEIIDTRAKWRRFRDTLGREIENAVVAMTPKGFSVAYDQDAMRELVELAPPGADELFAITRLADLLADHSVAQVIVDTAPTGHFLRLLDLPRTAGEWVREFMRILLRYREIVPAGALGEELLNASRALKALEASFHAPDGTAEASVVFVVTRPERIVVAETRRLLDELARRSVSVAGIIANYVTPASDCGCDETARASEQETLRPLGEGVVVIERHDAPVTRLDDIASLFDLHWRA